MVYYTLGRNDSGCSTRVIDQWLGIYTGGFFQWSGTCTEVLICLKSLWTGSLLIAWKRSGGSAWHFAWVLLNVPFRCLIQIVTQFPCAMHGRIPLPVDQVFRVAILIAAPSDSANHRFLCREILITGLTSGVNWPAKRMPAWSATSGFPAPSCSLLSV